jgi:hypothetical protein
MELPKRVNGRLAKQYLGCTDEQLKRLRKKRAIVFYRLGYRSLSYDVSSLDAYLNRVCCKAVEA